MIWIKNLIRTNLPIQRQHQVLGGRGQGFRGVVSSQLSVLSSSRSTSSSSGCSCWLTLGSSWPLGADHQGQQAVPLRSQDHCYCYYSLHYLHFHYLHSEFRKREREVIAKAVYKQDQVSYQYCTIGGIESLYNYCNLGILLQAILLRIDGTFPSYISGQLQYIGVHHVKCHSYSPVL